MSYVYVRCSLKMTVGCGVPEMTNQMSLGLPQGKVSTTGRTLRYSDCFLPFQISSLLQPNNFQQRSHVSVLGGQASIRSGPLNTQIKSAKAISDLVDYRLLIEAPVILLLCQIHLEVNLLSLQEFLLPRKSSTSLFSTRRRKRQ